MRSTLKKVIAAVLAVAMCISFTGCYSEDNTWAAKNGEDIIPIGVYIYFLSNSYSEAAPEIPSDTKILKGEVDGADAETWIRDKAEEYLMYYCFIEQKFDELGLTLTDEDQSNIDSLAQSMWSYYWTMLEEMGISEESLTIAYAEYNYKYEMVLEALYGKGGELEVSEEDLKAYYLENYYDYQYFTASLSKTNEEGNSESFTDDEKAELKEKLENYIDKINAGEMTLSEAASDYAYEAVVDSTQVAPGATKKDSISEDIMGVIDPIEENETVFFETETLYYVVQKLSMEDAFTKLLEDEESYDAVIVDMNADAFADYVEEQSKSLEGVELNENAMNSVRLSKLVTEGAEYGTKEVEEESEDSSETEESETSSEAE